MGGETGPEAVLKPSLLVGFLSGASKAGVAGAIATVVLVPVGWALELPWVPVSLALIGVGVVAAGLVALGRRFTVEYRIYEKKVEVTDGLFRKRTRIAPRSDIRYVSLSGGIFPAHVGGGTVSVSVRRHNTKFQVRLVDIADADHWYETLRPVEGGEPLGTFTPRSGPDLLERTTYLVAGVGSVGALLSVLAVYAVPTLSVPRIALWAFLVSVAGAGWQFLSLSSIEYRIYDDHIERHRIFMGADRSYAIAEHIDSVEHLRALPQQLFDVGTVAVNTRWRDGQFQLRSVDGSDEMCQQLRQSS